MKPQRSAHTTNIHHPPTSIRRQIRQNGFHEQHRPSHIDIVQAGELLASAVLEGGLARDAGVVYDLLNPHASSISNEVLELTGRRCIQTHNINLQPPRLGMLEMIHRRTNNMRRPRLSAHISLHRQTPHPILRLQLLSENLRFGSRGVGCVVDDQ